MTGKRTLAFERRIVSAARALFKARYCNQSTRANQQFNFHKLFSPLDTPSNRRTGLGPSRFCGNMPILWILSISNRLAEIWKGAFRSLSVWGVRGDVAMRPIRHPAREFLLVLHCRDGVVYRHRTYSTSTTARGQTELGLYSKLEILAKVLG